ncbi:DUF1772 domain-containing protein [Micromonospora sp. NPDC051196]|uniref:anthrone oxygenase family protein n=1 Tax=Micromonospora sp. NPDC051196 TaxID=3155281 RepID=UPI0034165B57
MLRPPGAQPTAGSGRTEAIPERRRDRRFAPGWQDRVGRHCDTGRVSMPEPIRVVVAVFGHLGVGGAVLGWLVAALVCHAVTFVVTMRSNVPLNNQLDAARSVDGTPDLAAFRRRFEGPWVRWNQVRTVSSVAAFACLIGALLAR